MKIISTLLFFAIYNIAVAQVPNYVSTVSLEGWYACKANPNDESSHHRNGNLFGGTPSVDRNGVANSCYRLNGTSDRIEVPATGITNLKYTTVSAWLNYTGNADQQRNFDAYFQFGDYGSVGFTYGYNYPNLSFNQYMKCKTGNYPAENITNNWHHVVIVQDSNISKTYVDGALNDSAAASAENCYGGSSTIYIGANPTDKQWMTGYIDDIGFWTRVLTPTEIMALYLSKPLAVQEENVIATAEIYPNPTNNNFTIRIPNAIANTNYTITDCTGKLVMNGKLVSTETLIQTSRFTPGIYFLQIGNQQIGSYKIIIL